MIQMIPKIEAQIQNLSGVDQVWPLLSSVQKTALIPYLETAMKTAMVQRRAEIRKLSPIKLEKTAIEKRAQFLTDLEKWAEPIKKIDWISVQYSYFKSLALAYQDFYQDISNIPLPPGFAEAEKAQFKQMLFQNSLPFQKQALKFNEVALSFSAKKIAQPLDLLAAVSAIQYSKPSPLYQKALAEAVQKRNVPTLTYMLQFAQKHELFKEPGEKIQMAIILFLSGGYTESEQLFREANVNAAYSQYQLIEQPARVPAKAMAAAPTETPSRAPGAEQKKGVSP